MAKWSLFFRMAISLVSSGQLWQHALYDDVAVFGVRRVQNKADFLAELRKEEAHWFRPE